MTDPLAELVTLLQPTGKFSKLVSSAGQWRVRRSETGQPFYGAVLEGAIRLHISGEDPIVLEVDDFVLIPSAVDFSISSVTPPAADAPDSTPIALPDGTFRIGTQEGPVENRVIIGHGVSNSPDASLLVSLLPRMVHVRNEKRLATLVQLVRDEARQQRPARDVILARLLEIVFIEALRSSETSATPGLVRALADPRLTQAIRCMHQKPGERWTIAQLATAAALSRSAFFERFTREVGMAPMEYLLGWRMALAKSALRNEETGIAVIAERVGYSSASAFSVAFTRQVGVTPTQYGKESRTLG